MGGEMIAKFLAKYGPKAKEAMSMLKQGAEAHPVEHALAGLGLGAGAGYMAGHESEDDALDEASQADLLKAELRKLGIM